VTELSLESCNFPRVKTGELLPEEKDLEGTGRRGNNGGSL
jgi:hypothetical protein